MKNIPPANNYNLHSNLGAGMSIDFADDFMQNFGADVREACGPVPPVFHNKKSATVFPFRRPVVPSVHNQEVTPCSNATCLSPISDA